MSIKDRERGRGWLERLEQRRVRRDQTIVEMCRELGVSRQTYANWQAGAQPNRRKLAAISTYLDEAEEGLAIELGASEGPALDALVQTVEFREISTRIDHLHARSMGAALGMVGAPIGPTASHPGLDVAAHLLRERLWERRVSVLVRPVYRGSRRHEPYQYQLCVLPDLADAGAVDQQSSRPSPADLEDLRRAVDVALDGTLLPLHREHSTELHPRPVEGRGDVLNHPALLAPRAPEISATTSEAADLLVLSTYYGGAPDVGALLAERRGYAFLPIRYLAQQMTADGLRGVPRERLRDTIRNILALVLRRTVTTAGPAVWATDEASWIHTPHAGDLLSGFGGTVVLLTLSDQALRYAAYRLCCADPQRATLDADGEFLPTDAEVAHQHERLVADQEALLHAVDGCERALVHEVDLPVTVPEVLGGQRIRDEVDACFDRYDEVAAVLHAHLDGGTEADADGG